MGELILNFISILSVIFVIPLTIFIISCIHFYRIQPRRLYAPHLPIEAESRQRDIPHEHVTYKTSDGKKIFALYVPADDSEDETEEETEEETENKIDPENIQEEPIVILFCHGNAGNIYQRMDTFIIFRRLGLDTFIFDYRGYGKSRGKTTEKGTYRDAEGAWKYLTEQRKIKPENIIVFGRSLGGGVAAYLAEKFKPAALIIESSFTSVTDMARLLYKWLPVRLLIRYRYDTRKRLKKVRCPVLIIHSPNDETIPYRHGLILYESANPPKRFLEIKDRHYQGFIKSGIMYTQGLNQFIRDVLDDSL